VDEAASSLASTVKKLETQCTLLARELESQEKARYGDIA